MEDHHDLRQYVDKLVYDLPTMTEGELKDAIRHIHKILSDT